MHRRTALSVSAALLAAAPLLSACSGEARPGTAAVVGGERITTSALQAQVNDVRAAQNRAGEAAAGLIQSTPGLDRSKLNRMLQTAVLERAAKDAGITLSRREIEEFRNEQLQKAGGAERLEASALEQAQLAPGQVEADLRFKLLRDRLFSHYGSPEKAVEQLGAVAQALRIEVNPRYGAWDAQQIAIGDQVTPWITRRTGPGPAPAGA
ncbi:SurA N-terminal domain-containing protein [Streptomyces sp. BR123]|uniref:SurA N-terminal domain-containing protein n=1 Tax=Streptomyces sp. BR123 TaxID=2749828 RepID=UPI00211B4DEF|nr:SurA N-terminal domain-containing protein [Streptomyces sp. BR123]